MSKAIDNKNLPAYSKENGCIYPFVFRLLQVERWLPSEALLLSKHSDSRLVTDLYLLAVWIIELAGTALLILLKNAIPPISIVIIVLLGYRLIEILVKLLATLILGKYRLPGRLHHKNRTVLLVMINLIEIILLYSAFYYCLDKYVLTATESIGIDGYFDALYFSIATGITISFGQQYPKNLCAKVTAISQPLIIFVVVMGMISFARGSNEERSSKQKQRI